MIGVVLQTVLLSAHLLAMNVAAAGPLVAILAEAMAHSSRQPATARIGQRLAAASLAAFFIGMILGLINGLLLWLSGSEAYFSALARMPSKVLFGVWELVFYVACMAAYIAWWKWAPPRRLLARVLHAQFALAAATNLLWHFPPLMILTNHLAQSAPGGGTIHAGAFRELVLTPHILSRSVHVWLASLASAGLLLAWMASGQTKGGPAPGEEERQATSRLARAGAWIALGASVLQLPVGVWVLLATPAAEQSQLLGENPLATALLGASVVAALWMMHQLANLALGAADRRGIAASALLLCATVLLMSATLRVRRESSMDQQRGPGVACEGRRDRPAGADFWEGRPVLRPAAAQLPGHDSRLVQQDEYRKEHGHFHRKHQRLSNRFHERTPASRRASCRGWFPCARAIFPSALGW